MATPTLKNKTLGRLIALSVLVCSCRPEHELGDNGDIFPIPEKDAYRIDFSMVTERVLRPRCLACHREEKKNQPDLSNYSAISALIVPGEPLKSDLFLSLQSQGGEMPLDRAPIGPNQEKLLELWIRAGARQ